MAGVRPLLLALPLLAAAACGPPDVPNLDSRGTTIVCFGDSITAGVGAADEASYPARLEAALGVPVVNAGVAGETAGEARLRLDRVLAEDPWLVVIELGGNDLLRRRAPADTEADLRAIVEAVLAAGAVPMLVEVRGPLWGGRYEDLFARLGADYDVPVVEDVLAEVLSTRELKSDAIHPNAAGYARLADAVAAAVEPLLAARRRRGLAPPAREAA
jgi:acyl-CoA hydrolase